MGNERGNIDELVSIPRIFMIRYVVIALWLRHGNPDMSRIEVLLEGKHGKAGMLSESL